MHLVLQAALWGLLCGPLAYLRINRPARAAVSAGIIALALLGFAYVHYLGVFAELDSGDATVTAIAATKIWLGSALSWGTGLIGLFFVLNVPCAIDAARLARKSRPTSATMA